MPLHSTVKLLLLAITLLCHPLCAQDQSRPAIFRKTIEVVDANSGKPIPARVYIYDSNGNHYFVKSNHPSGVAIPYSEEWVPMPDSIEQHTSVSAHPFSVDVPEGEYKIEIERGKEYIPFRQELSVSSTDKKPESIQTIRLQRWSEVAKKGWYSGETHVHRRIPELATAMQAEELNVTFPVTFWTIRSDRVPDLAPSPLRSQGPSPFGPREDRGFGPINLAPDYVIFPRNTEYEIFGIGDRQHVLGAIFVLNHRTPFALTAPPIRPIAKQAKDEGALLDLDKHNWPWSLMLIPIAKVDLYELSNNSVWRTNFGFKQAGMPLPPWAEFEQESPGVLTEWGWLQFGFEMYYALLNCGIHLSPTAGTASGVHPVPLGYSRVYIHTGEELDSDTWLDGLKCGRSFVTTGPMLMSQIEGKLPGSSFELTTSKPISLGWTCEVQSLAPISRIEWIVNGVVQKKIQPKTEQTALGVYRYEETGALDVSESGWAVVRTWTELPNGRKQFAHSAPWYFSVDKRPVRPPKVQIDYLLGQIERVTQEQQGILSPEAVAEFLEAREFYRKLRKAAHDGD